MPAANDVVWLDVLPNMKGFGPALTKGTSAQSAASGRVAGMSFGRAALAGVAVVATGAALATKALYNIGATFDEMTDTIRVGTGATGKDLEALSKTAKDVGTKVPASFKDIGTAIADINTRLGLTGKPLEKMSTQFLELSRITKTDVATNIKTVSRVFGDWDVAANKQSDTLDYLFKVSQSTGIGVDELSEKVVQFGAPLRQMGFDLNTSAAMLGKWEKEGVNTNAVLAGMKIGLGKFSKAGKDPVKAMDAIQKAIKGAGSAGKANAIAIEAFGQRAGPDMAAAIREGRFDLDELMGTLKGSKETIIGAGKDTRSFGEEWATFKNKVMVGLAPLAEKVFKGLTVGMTWINDNGIPAIKGMAKWMGENKTLLKTTAIVITALFVPAMIRATVAMVTQLATTLALNSAWLVYGLVTKGIAVGTAVMTAAQWLLNASFLAFPLTWIVIGLVALGVGLVVMYKKVGWFRTAVDKLWAGLKWGWNWVKKNWPLLVAILTGPFGIAAYLIIKHWDKIKSGLRAGYNWVKDKVFSPLGRLVTEKIPNAFKTGVSAIGNAWDKLKAIAKKPVNFVIDTVYNDGLRAGFNKIAGLLNIKKLPRMDPIGGAGKAILPAGPRTGVTAMGGKGSLGGVGGIGKTVAGKAWGWMKKAAMGPFNKVIGKVGETPIAKMAASGVRNLAKGALSRLKSVFDKSEGDGTGPGGVKGKAGQVMKRGTYRIGMPYHGYPGHNGADYPAAFGTPVFSPWPGKVTGSYDIPGRNKYNNTPFASYGRVIKIKHDNGLSTLYAHLAARRVGSGAKVGAGQQIGNVGSTGNSTGNHLHFEASRGGSTFNPARLGLFDNGGWMRPGMGGVNMTSKPEPVFTNQQWATLSRAVRPVLTGAGGSGGTLIAEADLSGARVEFGQDGLGEFVEGKVRISIDRFAQAGSQEARWHR